MCGAFCLFAPFNGAFYCVFSPIFYLSGCFVQACIDFGPTSIGVSQNGRFGCDNTRLNTQRLVLKVPSPERVLMTTSTTLLVVTGSRGRSTYNQARDCFGGAMWPSPHSQDTGTNPMYAVGCVLTPYLA